jgi:protease I
MRSISFVFCVVVVIGALSMPVRAAQDQERKAVEQAVQYYFAGGDNEDLESMKKAFHIDAKMFFIRDGALVQVTMPEWFDRIAKAPKGSPKALSRKIVSVDIAENAASVRADSEFPTFRFIDYLSLLKINGEWKIVVKIFYRQNK